eukprot:11840826-Karenia_brevis.AAC.1
MADFDLPIPLLAFACGWIASPYGKPWWKGSGRGRGQGSSQSGRGRGKSAAGPSVPPAYAVKPDNCLVKQCLRSYFGDAGPFFLNGAPTEEAYFEAGEVMRFRDASNCEGVARLKYWLSFIAANSEGGGDCIQGVFGAEQGVDLATSGLEHFVQRFASESGQKYLQAAEYLNTKNHHVARSREETTTQTSNFWEFEAEDIESDHNAAVKLMG